MRTVQRTFLVAAIVFLALAGYAQNSYGLRAGVHYGEVSVPSISNSLNLQPKLIKGADVGIFAELGITDNFSFRPELNYIEKGFRVAEGLDFNISGLPLPLGLEALTKVKYVQVPVLGKYAFGLGGTRAYLIGGPAVGYAAKANLRTRVNSIVDFNISNTDIDLTNNNYQRWDINGIAGAGVEFDLGSSSLFLEGRYTHSFNNLLSDPLVELEMRNKGFGLSAGYKMTF